MREISLELGGRTFSVAQLPIRREQAWRVTVQELIDGLASGLALADRPIASAADVAAAVRAAGALSDGTATIDALCAYAPELEAEREWLLDHAYADEAAEAVIKLFFGAGRRPRPQPATNGAALPHSQTT